jgi:gas vesicle protein
MVAAHYQEVVLKGYLFALGIGYVIGTLWAPRKGSELRKDILEHFQTSKAEVLSEGREILHSAVEHGEEFLDEAGNRFKQASISANKAKTIAKETISKFAENVSDIAEDSSKLFTSEPTHG